MDANVQHEGDSSVSAAEGRSETAQFAQCVLNLHNPWPYLVPLFKLIMINGNTFRFKWLLCHLKRGNVLHTEIPLQTWSNKWSVCMSHTLMSTA